MKILVVDDDPHSLFIAFRAAERHTIIQTNRPNAALALLQINGSYDCVILDWMMPDMTGISIARTIRKDGLGRPYILMLTCKSIHENEVEAKEAGVDDFVVKPITAAELAAKLNAIEDRLK